MGLLRVRQVSDDDCEERDVSVILTVLEHTSRHSSSPSVTMRLKVIDNSDLENVSVCC